jgi:hypothetical protein
MWYGQTIKALEDLNLVPDAYQGESRQSLLHSLFSEIVALTCVSHACRICFLAMKRNVPSLPCREELKDSPAPRLLDMTTLLKPGAALYRSSSFVGFTPALRGKDLDPVKTQQAFSQEDYQAFLRTLDPKRPWGGLTLSPQDVIFLSRCIFTCMCENISAPYEGLNPKKHCSDSFTRYDKETVAVALAKTYGCDF